MKLEFSANELYILHEICLSEESETPLSQVLLLDNMFNDVAEDGYVELELAKKTALQFYKRLTHGN